MFTCVRTDNMSGTVLGNDLVTLKYESGNLENGTIVKIGALVEGEREVRVASIPAVGDSLSDLAVIATPEVIKDKDVYGLGEFTNKAGELMRGYRLKPGAFSVTIEGFAASQTPAVGDIVEVNGSGKMIAVASATENSTKIGKILAIEGDWYVIEIA